MQHAADPWLEKLPDMVRRRLEREPDALLRRVEAIRQADHAVRARMAEWINAFDVAADEAREHGDRRVPRAGRRPHAARRTHPRSALGEGRVGAGT